MKNKKNKGISNRTVTKCEEAIGYKFKNSDFLRMALTHASARESECNERLEFLGDAILSMVISEYLYHTFRDFDEGDLSLIRSEVVSRAALAEITSQMTFQKYLVFGGNIREDSKLPVSILANVYEAVVGAIYLDSGIKYAKKFILDGLRGKIEEVIKNPYQNNYKSLLQFIAQKHLNATPSYKILKQAKTNLPCFTSYAVINGRKFIAAQGKNKKESEQLAAHAALQILALENPIIAANPALRLSFVRKRKGKSELLNMPSLFHNSKRLLEYVIKKYNLPKIKYKRVRTVNQAEKKIFYVSVSIGGRSFSEAENESYKEAERLAARMTLGVLAEELSHKVKNQVTPESKLYNIEVPTLQTPDWYQFSMRFQ